MEQDPDAGLGSQGAQPHPDSQQPHHIGNSDVSFLYPDAHNHSSHAELSNIISNSTNHETPADENAPSRDLDADAFYKPYQLQSISPSPAISAKSLLPMATSASQPSIRSNRDVGSMKRTVLPEQRSPPRTNLRSVSGPVGGRSAGAPSVKDLMKRFDQNDGSASNSRVPLRSTASSQARRDPVTPLRNRGENGSLPPARLHPSGSSPDVSSPKSFANRINNPRRLTSESVTSIKRTNATHAQGDTQTQLRLSRDDPSSQRLLFGEILPEQRDAPVVGYGIQPQRPRRTSESSIHDFARPRSFSDPDVEPSSAANWYRNVEASQEAIDELQHDTPRRKHNRSQSDASSAQFHSPQHLTAKSLFKTPTPSKHISPSVSTSKLPVPVRRINSPTGSESSHHSRPNSPPSTRRTLQNGGFSRTSPPNSRAKTPTSRAKTPTHQSTRERRPPPPSLPSSSNSRVPAYVSVPPPSQSPTQRGSRTRQSVTMASTASSRMRESAKHHSRANDHQGRRRNISVGPIDFEQRREHIRLAYSKSIRESQVLEAQQKAAAQEEPLPSLPSGIIADHLPSAAKLSDINSEKETGKAVKTPTLTISTSQVTESNSVVLQTLNDSPTLGLPGSFPEATPPLLQEEIPQSAISAGSATTEFDNEPQTTPAVPAQTCSPLGVPRTVIEPPSPQVTQAQYRKSEYKYPFAEEVGMVKEESLADGGIEPSTTQPAGSQRWSSAAPSVNNDDFEESFNRPPPQPENYETTVTILPPEGLGQSTTTQLIPPLPFPRMPQQDESDYCSELDNGPEASQSRYHGSDYATTEACTEDIDDRDRAERHYGKEYASRRASTCASSDAGGALQDHAYDQPFTTGSASGLGIPPYRQHGKRSSHQSAWTDYSVETSDGALGTDSPFARSQHQLPEVDTGEGFSVPYLSPSRPRVPSHLPSPDHEPPPIPPSASGSAFNSRPSSAYYDQSHSSTLLNSERESDGYASYNDTPRSVDTPSFEAGEQESLERSSADTDSKVLATDGAEPTGKERQRLVQRRNVIRELVDTEAVFVRDMNIVEEIYKGTAEACPKLDDQTVKIVFRNSHEIIEFHTTFLAELKVAVAGVYVPKGGRTAKAKQAFTTVENDIPQDELSDIKDRDTAIGEVFQRNIDKMKTVHESFLRNSDQAAKRLIQIQQDSTVKVWLTECNEVAKDLTAAWDLDSLLIKPMQRITKYPNLIITMLQHTPQDHPDREELTKAKDILETAIIEINKTKKNFELVGQIVGRKRKESDVKTGLARAFGKRVDKLQTSGIRPIDDAAYTKLKEKFGDDYLRLQVVLRDVEFYTRQVSEYVHEFLQYLSSIELVMRLQPGSYPELESKWVQFNISMRDLEKVVLEDHLAQVRKHVIEPFEQVIKAYGNPSLAMKKRQKRRVDFEKAEQLKRGGKSLDPKLRELVEQYDALNDALLKELPKLSVLTERVGNVCLGNFVNIQTNWYRIWREKMKTVLIDCPDMPEPQDIISAFQRDHPYAADQMANIGILNPANRGRPSQSATNSIDEGHRYLRSRTADPDRRGRGLSVNNDATSSSDLTPRNSDSISMTPSHNTSLTAAGSSVNAPSPHQYYYRDYYSGIQQYAGSSASPKSSEVGAASSKSLAGTGHTSTRPSTSRSYDSGGVPRQSSDSSRYKRDSNTYNANQLPQDTSRFSNLFHSALPLNDGPYESQRSSRASSRDRGQEGDGYNVLWLAASLFEFNITTTKHEAGYPYLTYQAGEIFDVIAEKGELWLAKNQDDHTQKVGWIWSKHFARLADS